MPTNSVNLLNNLPVRLSGVVIAGAAVLAAPGTHEAASCWHTVPGPAVPAADSGNLLGVSMSGPASGWAVGFTLPTVRGQFRPLLARWDGHRWRAARLPAGATGFGRLDGIAALSPSNVWAVGEKIKNNFAGTPLIIHWNGHRWARVPAAPVPGNGYSELLGVAAASPSDIWAVGEAENNIRADKLRTVTEHWNGRAWTLVPSPNLGTKSGLTAVAVASNHQAWAVGGAFAQTGRSFVLHWTGHSWQRAATPPAPNADLEGVAAVSPTQVWAVGDDGSFSRPPLPYSLRWNGHAWRSVPVPAGPPGDNRLLNSVTVLRGGRLAAVGGHGPAENGALYAQWNGRRWMVVAGPLNGTDPVAITTQGHALWTVGAKDQSASRFVPLVQTCRQ